MEIGSAIALSPLVEVCKARMALRIPSGLPGLTSAQRTAVEGLISYGEARVLGASGRLDFGTRDAAAEEALNDIQGLPHIFVLGCVMDRQVPAARAWIIPVRVGQACGSLAFPAIASISERELIKLFKDERLHRFPEKMAVHFHKATQQIATQHGGDAGQIWKPGSSAAGVIRRFLELDGVGLKIANMAANILAREFKVVMSEYASIDIAPDSRVKKFFDDHAMLKTKKREEILYLAREICPWFPGLLDIGAWEWERRGSGCPASV